MREVLAPNVREAVDRANRLALSPAEAAELLGITKPTLYKFLRDGRLPSLKMGTRRLIRRESLDAFLANLERGGAA